MHAEKASRDVNIATVICRQQPQPLRQPKAVARLPTAGPLAPDSPLLAPQAEEKRGWDGQRAREKQEKQERGRGGAAANLRLSGVDEHGDDGDEEKLAAHFHQLPVPELRGRKQNQHKTPPVRWTRTRTSRLGAQLAQRAWSGPALCTARSRAQCGPQLGAPRPFPRPTPCHALSASQALSSWLRRRRSNACSRHPMPTNVTILDTLQSQRRPQAWIRASLVNVTVMCSRRATETDVGKRCLAPDRQRRAFATRTGVGHYH
eukprot:1946465-Rhodomonas_salina.2